MNKNEFMHKNEIINIFEKKICRYDIRKNMYNIESKKTKKCKLFLKLILCFYVT